MVARQTPRRISRELALLGLSQLRGNPEKIEEKTLHDLILEAIRALSQEVRDTLETASAETQRGSDRLATSEFKTTDLASARALLKESLELTQTAINRLGTVTEFPELIHFSTEPKVREYALELIQTVKRRRDELQQEIEQALVEWQWKRIPQIDRNILLLAVAEIRFLDVPNQVAINEAVELSKQYADEETARFINGVLRRVVSQSSTKRVDS